MNVNYDHIRDVLQKNPNGVSIPEILRQLPRKTWFEDPRVRVVLELVGMTCNEDVQCIPGPTDETTLYKWIAQ